MGRLPGVSSLPNSTLYRVRRPPTCCLFNPTAAELARRELAPLALHAYCEAYSDFKRCMLALVSQSSGGSGGTEADAAEASPELEDFAGMLARAVRQENGGYSGAQGAAASQLPKLLRYLLLLHQHQAHSGFHPYW